MHRKLTYLLRSWNSTRLGGAFKCTSRQCLMSFVKVLNGLHQQHQQQKTPFGKVITIAGQKFTHNKMEDDNQEKCKKNIPHSSLHIFTATPFTRTCAIFYKSTNMYPWLIPIHPHSFPSSQCKLQWQTPCLQKCKQLSLFIPTYHTSFTPVSSNSFKLFDVDFLYKMISILLPPNVSYYPRRFFTHPTWLNDLRFPGDVSLAR